jgi:hypothetical protein
MIAQKTAIKLKAVNAIPDEEPKLTYPKTTAMLKARRDMMQFPHNEGRSSGFTASLKRRCEARKNDAIAIMSRRDLKRACVIGIYAVRL